MKNFMFMCIIWSKRKKERVIKMARRQMILDDKLEERVKKYCDKNGLTFTTFTHMALAHYLEHIKLSKSLSEVMKDYVMRVIEKQSKD